MRRVLAVGLALMTGAGAVLLLACTVLPLLLLEAAGSPVGWPDDGAWPYLSVMAFVLSALMPVVMLAIYVRQIEEVGVLGLIGLVASWIGSLAYLGFQFDMAFVWPVLAERAPELLNYSGPMFRYPPFAFVHSWLTALYSVGVVLFGIALVRARVFPPAASVLFTIGVILSEGVLFPPLLVRTVGGIVGAPAVWWMALILWRRTRKETAAT